MSNQPPFSRPRPAALPVATALTSAFLLSIALAAGQAGAGEPTPAEEQAPLFNDVSGHVSMSYYYSGVQGEDVKFGSEGGVLSGVVFGAGLSFDLANFEFALLADRLNLSGQNLTLTVDHDQYLGKLSFENTPPATVDDDRSSDLSIDNSFRLEGLPSVRLSLGHKRRSPDHSRLSLNSSISDSYRDVTSALENLRWQLGYRLSASSREGDDTRYRHGTRIRLSGAVSEEQRPEVEFRPSFTARFDWDLADDREFDHGYDLSVLARSEDREESLGIDFGIDFEHDGEVASEEAVDYTTGRLGPFDVNAAVSFEQDEDEREADYRLGLGVDVGNLQASGGYHGRSGSDGASNGVEASVQYRLSVRPWYLSARADGDLQFLVGGGIEPASRVSLNMRYRGAPLSASATGYLRYDGERVSGRAEVSGDYQSDAASLSATGGVLVSRDVSTNIGLSGRTRIVGGLWIQGEAGYRAEFSDDTDRVFTLGLGLRYDVGGER